jgi:hypothetical protein
LLDAITELIPAQPDEDEEDETALPKFATMVISFYLIVVLAEHNSMLKKFISRMLILIPTAVNMLGKGIIIFQAIAEQ